jgi:hypothetical protein
MAKVSGAKVLLLNMSETPIDSMADVILRLPGMTIFPYLLIFFVSFNLLVGECLPRIMDIVKSQSAL